MHRHRLFRPPAALTLSQTANVKAQNDIVPALLFGLAHVYYQGLRGLVFTGAIGLAFGTMFLLFKRNLWPLVLWHGIVDTLTFTAIFMNWE